MSEIMMIELPVSEEDEDQSAHFLMCGPHRHASGNNEVVFSHNYEWPRFFDAQIRKDAQYSAQHDIFKHVGNRHW